MTENQESSPENAGFLPGIESQSLSLGATRPGEPSAQPAGGYRHTSAIVETSTDHCAQDADQSSPELQIDETQASIPDQNHQCCDDPRATELRCKSDYHCLCEAIDPDMLDRVDIFYCRDCELRHGSLTRWKQRVPDHEKRIEKRKHYHTVEKIFDYHEDREENTRYFLIRWKGCTDKDDTWEPEDHLDGCIDLLQRFCRQRKISLSRITAYYGCSNLEQYNENNWVSIATLTSSYKKFETRVAKDIKLPIQQFRNRISSYDCLLLYPENFHLYTIVYYRSARLCVVADGTNDIRTNLALQDELKSKLCLLYTSDAADE